VVRPKGKKGRLLNLLMVTVALGLFLSFAGCQRSDSNCSNINNQQGGIIDNQQEKPPEMYVFSLFKGEETTASDAKKIISTLPKLNWSVYNKQSNGGAMKLLTWLYDRQINDVTDITCVLKATTGLDGVFANQYANVVGKLCSGNTAKFVDALGMLTSEQVDKICGFLKFYATEVDVSPTKNQLNVLLKSSEVTAKQKSIIEKLIKTFK